MFKRLRNYMNVCNTNFSWTFLTLHCCGRYWYKLHKFQLINIKPLTFHRHSKHLYGIHIHSHTEIIGTSMSNKNIHEILS